MTMLLRLPNQLPKFNYELTLHLQRIFHALHFPYDTLSWQVPIQPSTYSELHENSAHLTLETILDQKKLISSDFSPEVMESLKAHIRKFPPEVQTLFDFSRGRSSSRGTRYRLVVKSGLALKSEAVILAVENGRITSAGKKFSDSSELMNLCCLAVDSALSGELSKESLIRIFHHQKELINLYFEQAQTKNIREELISKLFQYLKTRSESDLNYIHKKLSHAVIPAGFGMMASKVLEKHEGKKKQKIASLAWQAFDRYIPGGILTLFTLLEQPGAIPKKVIVDSEVQKNWVIEEGNRLIREFYHVKAQAIKSLQIALKDCESPQEQSNTTDIYIQEMKRLQEYYQAKIDEIKSCHLLSILKLRADEGARKLERRVKIIEFVYSIASYYLPPSHLGLLVTEGIRAGMSLGGSSYLDGSLMTKTHFQNQSMIFLSTNGSVRRGIAKGQKQSQIVIGLLPLVIHAEGSIRDLDKRIENRLARLEGHTRYVLKLPYNISDLGPKALFSDILHEFEHAKANVKWVERFMEKLLKGYNARIEPEMINLIDIQHQLKSDLERLAFRVKNKLLSYERRPQKGDRIQSLQEMSQDIEFLLHSEHAFFNRKDKRVSVEKNTRELQKQYLNDSQVEIQTQLAMIKKLVVGLSSKKIVNHEMLINEFEDRISALSLESTSPEIYEIARVIQAKLREELHLVALDIQISNEKNHDKIPVSSAVEHVAEFARVIQAEFVPGLYRTLRDNELGVVAHRYDVEKDLKIVRDFEKLSHKNNKPFDAIYIVPCAIYSENDVLQTDNSGRLDDYAKLIAREMDWVLDLLHHIESKKLLLANKTQLKEYYAEQILKLEIRLDSLKRRPTKKLSEQYSGATLYQTFLNNAKNWWFVTEADDTLKKLRERLHYFDNATELRLPLEPMILTIVESETTIPEP